MNSHSGGELCSSVARGLSFRGILREKPLSELQGPSWSSVDYGGHYRLLHYTAKKFFSPLLVSADYDRNTNIASVFLTSDVNQPLAGTLSCTVP